MPGFMRVGISSNSSEELEVGNAWKRSQSS